MCTFNSRADFLHGDDAEQGRFRFVVAYGEDEYAEDDACVLLVISSGAVGAVWAGSGVYEGADGEYGFDDMGDNF